MYFVPPERLDFIYLFIFKYLLINYTSFHKYAIIFILAGKKKRFLFLSPSKIESPYEKFHFKKIIIYY